MVAKNGMKEFERLLSLARIADSHQNIKLDSTLTQRSNMANLNDVETKILPRRSNKSRSTDV